MCENETILICNTRNHLTVCNQMNPGSNKINCRLKNSSFTNHIYLIKNIGLYNTFILKRSPKWLVTFFYSKLSFKNACRIFIQFCHKSQWWILLCVLNETTMDYKPKLNKIKRFTIETWNLFLQKGRIITGNSVNFRRQEGKMKPRRN